MRKTSLVVALFLAMQLILTAGLPIIGMAAEPTDAMIAINEAFSSYKTGETIQVADDGYIGIPVDVSVFFDKSNTAKSGHNGTPVIVYVVNTNTERVGTDSDVKIITSMLEKGYIISVLDYKNNPLATGQPLEWSVQKLRENVKNKKYFTDGVFPAGTYYDNYVVPAGYNVSLNNVYWEMDKHASDGTFEWIINNWNTDFRGIKGDKLLKWVHEDGTRKKTLEAAKDGTAPVWYNASGAVDENGQYTKVKYTVAEKITDCVKPDGSPIDLNQSMSIVYPTNPAKKVPVYTMASSSEYLAATPQVSDRVHFNGFVFRGYAGVVFEYGYIPMARDDSYGVYNGSQTTYANAVTNDSDNYGVHMYDDKRINTAAMRYIRYKALSKPSVYKFDIDHIGIVGNSKGGAMSFVGEKIVQEPLVSNPSAYATTEELELAIDAKINSIISRRGHVGHNNETRFQNGKTETYTEDGVTIDGGEKQPWLTYNGVEIESGAQLVWASNGVSAEDISEGHSPQIVMCHEQDPWHYYGPLNEFANICYSHDIPMLHFEVPLGHTVAYGKDLNYDIDTYEASFDFIDYWLKGDAVKVLYTDTPNGGANAGVTDGIQIKFTGSVSEDEINKITVKASDNIAVTGNWKPLYGKTLWEFTPDVLKGNTSYTLTVPASLKGENGVEMGEDYKTVIHTEYDVNAIAAKVAETSEGTYFTMAAPEISGNSNSVKIRFKVANDGANIAELYAVENFDASNPASSQKGEFIGEVNIKGKNYYEIDATDYIAKNQGKQLAFLLVAKKESGTSRIFTSDFSENVNQLKVGEMTTLKQGSAPDGSDSAVVIRTDSGSKYNEHVIYNSCRITAFTVKDILGFKVSEADYGRKFTFKVKMYDTISRQIQLRLNTNTNQSYETVDYRNSMYNFKTKANEWATYTFDYVVYDTDYGKVGLKNKDLIVQISHTGANEIPVYIGEITVDETVTDVDFDNISVSLEDNGSGIYKAPESTSAFALYSKEGTRINEFSTWKEAIAGYKYGHILKLTGNYTLTDDELYGDFSTLAEANGEAGHIFDIDLNGYTINSKNSEKSLLWLKNTSKTYPKTTINMYNGNIFLKNTALVSYESSTTGGAGKKFELNFSNINIGILENAYMDSVISATSIASGANAAVDINFDECNINLPGSNLTPEYKVIFPSGGAGLDIFYTVKGGNINLSSQRWIKVHDKLENSKFVKGEKGKYTTLTMPVASKVSSAAYMLDVDAASYYEKVSEENNIATYELMVSILSTRYGVIPKEYESVDDYPFVLFNEAGTFIGASTQLYGTTSKTSITEMAKSYLSDNKYSATTKDYGANPLAAFAVLRKDYTLGTTETHGNLAQIQGTFTVDLNGHTLTQNKKPLIDSTAKRWGSSGDLAIFPTEILFEHGKIKVKDNSIAQITAWAANNNYDVKDKEFIHTFNDVTFELAEGATVSSLFTITQRTDTPDASSKAIININDCKFDFDTVKPSGSLTLFNANSPYIKVTYNIKGSEIYADSMSGITLSSISEGNSVIASANKDGEYLKVYVNEQNKNTFSKPIMETISGDAPFVEASKSGKYALYTLRVPKAIKINKVDAVKFNDDKELAPVNVTDVVMDGKITSNTSAIKYYSTSGVTSNGLDKTKNENQHWLIELDDVYKLNNINVVYGYTDKWVNFRVQVSTDNKFWTDLGTVQPVVSERNTPVEIDLKNSVGKYIKLTVINRNGTSSAATETTAWGANTGATCEIALYEITSIQGDEYTGELPKEAKIANASVTKYNSSNVIETFDIKSIITDGVIDTNDSNIQYFSSNGVSTNSLDKTENASQHWFIELDDVYELNSMSLVYGFTNKWVNFNVKVSVDNEEWTDLGTIKPVVAAVKNGTVMIPFDSAIAKYIKITTVNRNGTSSAATETTTWGANLGSGCSIALYEVTGITGVPFDMSKMPVKAKIANATARRYKKTVEGENTTYSLETADVKSVITDGKIATNDSTIEYFKLSAVNDNDTLDKTENANQHWLIELDKIYELDTMSLVYGFTNKWVNFNVKVSVDNEEWTDLGTIQPKVAELKDDPVSIKFGSVYGKYIKLTVISRNGTSAASTETTTWGANLGAGCSIALYEILEIKGIPYNSPFLPNDIPIASLTATKYSKTVEDDNTIYSLETVDVKDGLTDGVLVSNNSTIEYVKLATVENNDTINKTDNANQHWLIKLDGYYKLNSIEAAYTNSQKWVNFNIKVSDDNVVWNDLGTIKPKVADVKNGYVTIPLGGVEGRYIKITVINRNGTNDASNETTTWGANLAAGCSLGFFELSVKGIPAGCVVTNEAVGDTAYTCDIYADEVYNGKNAVIVIAFYDSEDRLITSALTPITFKTGKNEVSINGYAKCNYETYKLIIWDSLSTLKPIENLNFHE